MQETQTQVTALLSEVENGDSAAADRLLRLVYDELHRVAQAIHAREGNHAELQTTVLFQEAYMRLMGGNGSTRPQSRQQFFAFAARAMRQFLVDHARKRDAEKRGGGQAALEIDSCFACVDCDPTQILAVNEALEKLKLRDPEKARLVELRYFVGLTVDETAEVLGVSPRQVDKEWHFARAWLQRELA